MWNTMECKRDSSNGSLGGASETHWECVSHCLKGTLCFLDLTKCLIKIKNGYDEVPE